QPKPRMEVIPDGGERALGSGQLAVVREAGTSGPRTVLYLGRLHPLKGLELLVEAWGILRQPSRPLYGRTAKEQKDNHGGDGWRLVIAGPDEEGTLAALKRQAQELKLTNTICFLGPIYGAEKERLLCGADLFVLPSRSENFGLVVAEALAAGVPVIATRATPWAELLGDPTGAGRCGWWVDAGAEPLASALREAMNLTDGERQGMGRNGRQLVNTKYRWEAVAERMVACYRCDTSRCAVIE
ncbi:MAG: glycosyltransferase, partial [Kiritimatiellae bacterium]|nr:glycosyltransferase [Kiritimatiellia bacterium]